MVNHISPEQTTKQTFRWGPLGSQKSLNRQTTGSTFSSGKRKKNKQSCSFCGFFSVGQRFFFFFFHIASADTCSPRKATKIHWRGQSYTHSMHSFLPPELLSSFHFLSSYGRWRRWGVGAAGAWENKNPERKRMEKEEKKKERERRS